MTKEKTDLLVVLASGDEAWYDPETGVLKHGEEERPVPRKGLKRLCDPQRPVWRKQVSSSTIKRVGYNFKLRRLYVKFVNGGSYAYMGVSATEFFDFITAESQGKWFHLNIKNTKDWKKLS